MTLMNARNKLKELSDRMREERDRGAAPQAEKLTVREFLRWFDFYRRSRYNVDWMRGSLSRHGLRTNPDFEGAWIDETISIELQQDRDAAGEPTQSPIDPTTRITVIGSAQQKPISIKPDAPLNEAFTLMRMEDIAQLPVMPNERDIKGVITWRSMSEMLAKKADQLTALQLIDSSLPDIPTIPIDAPLFQAIDSISKYGFVLVRAKDNTLTGPVTASDIAEQYAQLAWPYLMIGEIERHLRALIHGKFTPQQLNESRLDSQVGDSVGLPDLTFGEFVRLLQKNEHWELLGLPFIDHREFVKRLDWLRERRNDIMHFQPDGLEPDDVLEIERILKFFRDFM